MKAPKLWLKNNLLYLLVDLDLRVPEEGHGGAAAEGPVGDVLLLRQVFGVLDRGDHPLDREEGGQVGRVRRDDDQGEEPPEAGKCSSRHGTEVRIENLFDDYKTTKLSPAKLFYQNSYKGI